MRYVISIIMVLINTGCLWAQRDFAQEIINYKWFDAGKIIGTSLLPDSLVSEFPNSYFEGGVLKLKPYLFIQHYDTIWVETHQLPQPYDSMPYDSISSKFIRLQKWVGDGNRIATKIFVPDGYNCSKDYEFHMGMGSVKNKAYCYYDYKVKPQYLDEFPNGLPHTKQPVRVISFLHSHYEWLPLRMWDSILSAQPDCHLNRPQEWWVRDDQGDFYILFPEGHYRKWHGGYTCYGNYSSASIQQIQEALNERGYNVDVTNELDDITKQALLHFQKTHGLPQGNLNMETLRALCLVY